MYFFKTGFTRHRAPDRRPCKQISTSISRIRYFQMRRAHKMCTLSTQSTIFERAFDLLLIVYLVRVLLISIYFSFFFSIVDCACECACVWQRERESFLSSSLKSFSTVDHTGCCHFNRNTFYLSRLFFVSFTRFMKILAYTSDRRKTTTTHQTKSH